MQPRPVLSVILPTYKEEGAIGHTLDGVAAALDAAGVTWEALVVDDDSPDGTHADVQQAQARHGDRIRLIVRKDERGLASAVVRGFHDARGELLAVMDADGQHPAQALVDMVRAAQADAADVVIGSRHTAGGSLGGFGPLRRFVSWSATALARLALPTLRRARVTDPMSGLFLVRRGAIDGVTLDPVGYKILLEVLAKARPARGRRLKIREVPYTFGARTHGESKLGMTVMLDFLVHLARLGLSDRENRRIVEFLAVGGSGVIVNMGLVELWALMYGAPTGLSLQLGGALAREGAVISNFLLNDYLTFRDMRHSTGHGMFRRFLHFNVVSLLAFIPYQAALFALDQLGAHYRLATFIAILISVVFNFKGNMEWTYRHHEDRPTRRWRGKGKARLDTAE